VQRSGSSAAERFLPQPVAGSPEVAPACLNGLFEIIAFPKGA